MSRAALFLALLVSGSAMAQTGRLSTDYEIARVQKELREKPRGINRVAAHLNLGELYASRNERRAAATEFTSALSEATSLRTAARKSSDMAGYARATGYSALAHAKLGNRGAAYSLFEESTRYLADSAAAWNLYASGMSALGEFEHAIAAARNAVAVTEAEMDDPSREDVLDLNVYRYALAAALGGAGRASDAIATLEEVIASLESPLFDRTRAEITRTEEFEMLSNVSRDSSTFVTLLARARVRLGALYEKSGQHQLALAQYRKTLEQRSDEPNALAAMARLARDTDDRRRLMVDAFEANPFSPPLIAQYLQYLDDNAALEETSTLAGTVRNVVELIHRGRFDAAASALETLRSQNRENETLIALNVLAARGAGKIEEATRLERLVRSADIRRRLLAPREEAELDVLAMLANSPATLRGDELHQLADRIRRNQLNATERQALDAAVLQQNVRPEGAVSDGSTTSFERGFAAEVPFRFPAVTRFTGDFSSAPELKLTFRILGWSDDDRGGALLLEPVSVSR